MLINYKKKKWQFLSLVSYFFKFLLFLFTYNLLFGQMYEQNSAVDISCKGNNI